jgi:hypothetical protein
VTPRSDLAEHLASDRIASHVIGDCAGVRRIEGANLDANNLAVAPG